MLVLSRKAGEAVTIGDSVEVTVVSVKGNRVVLGFTAGTETKILRRELQPHEVRHEDSKSLSASR